MRALLVRIGADQSVYGGCWNGPVDPITREFVYVPIPDDGPFHPGMATPYSMVSRHLSGKWPALLATLAPLNMHLDPDFAHLTYGDQGQRALQISSKLGSGDLLVFYAGLKDIHASPRLIYAIIGLMEIEQIVPTVLVSPGTWHQNAHTRRSSPYGPHDIVVRGKRGTSGRCERAIPIGHFAKRAYRALPALLTAWGGLGVAGGYLQRSARLPEFLNAAQFYHWFKRQKVALLPRNN